MNLKDKKISIKEMNDNLTDPDEKEKVIYLYDDDTSVRSITFISEDDGRKTFYYHNLITHEYRAGTDTLELHFTSGIFELKGKNLILLDKYIKKHKISDIYLNNERYISTLNLDDDDVAIFYMSEIKK